jgi:hypothetical protein
MRYLVATNPFMQDAITSQSHWPLWRKVLFRCCFIFFVLIAVPINWLGSVPGLGWLIDLYSSFDSWLVNSANRAFLHVKPVLVPLNGSGDTSYGWAALWTYCCMALAGGLIWSVLDRKRPAYVQLNYWLCVLLRFHLAFIALGYGIAKLFLTQMPFPNTSELATPLGDFLPMRLSWMFIGYSAPYQFFSGLMECLAGLLLLYRRTATLGTMLAFGVFLNVAVLNLSYDIPVKIFSIEMVAVSGYLLANEWKRIACFFLLNRPADACSIYHFPLRRRWMRIGRIVLKCCFLILAIGFTTAQTMELHDYYNNKTYEALKPGLYDVSTQSINGAELLPTDSLRWKDVALDGKRSGSMKTADTSFDRIYGRGYFVYDVDTAQRTMELRRMSNDNLVASLHYIQPDTASIMLSGRYKGDSVQVMLKRSPHQFQLAERQFHWLSESNR